MVSFAEVSIRVISAASFPIDHNIVLMPQINNSQVKLANVFSAYGIKTFYSDHAELHKVLSSRLRDVYVCIYAKLRKVDSLSLQKKKLLTD